MSLAATVIWTLLVAAELGWLPGSQFAWAFGLLRYLSWPLATALAAAALPLCHRRPRAAILRIADRLPTVSPRLPRFVSDLLVVFTVTIALWLVRERQLSGDSPLLLLAVQSEEPFVFPDTGATWLLVHVRTVASSIGVGIWPAAQIWSCLWGGLTALLIVRTAPRLAPDWPLATALLFSGGLVRIFAGHVETYPVLLAMVAGFVWAGMVYLERRDSVAGLSLTLGVAVWVHAAAICLYPSFVWLLWGSRPDEATAAKVRRIASGSLFAALPMVAFLAGSAAISGYAGVGAAFGKALEIVGQSSEATATRWWVRLSGEPSIGTDVVLFSRAHLKYLLNAAHLLSPWMIPAITIVALRHTRAFLATPSTRFLSLACAPLVLYAFALRPFWGPYDWDLFAPCVLVGSLLAVHLLATVYTEHDFREIALVMLGFAWLFVTIPFLATGVFDVKPAGPFAVPLQDYELRKPLQPAPEWLAPWL